MIKTLVIGDDAFREAFPTSSHLHTKNTPATRTTRHGLVAASLLFFIPASYGSLEIIMLSTTY